MTYTFTIHTIYADNYKVIIKFTVITYKESKLLHPISTPNNQVQHHIPVPYTYMGSISVISKHYTEWERICPNISKNISNSFKSRVCVQCLLHMCRNTIQLYKDVTHRYTTCVYSVYTPNTADSITNGDSEHELPLYTYNGGDVGGFYYTADVRK